MRLPHVVFASGMSLAIQLPPYTWAQNASQTHQPLGPTATPFGYGDLASRWPRDFQGVAQISVCWENMADANAMYRAAIRNAMRDTWESAAAISLNGWNGCAGGASNIRIYVRDDGPHTKGLGNQLNGVAEGMVLNFTFSAWVPSTWCLQNDNNRLQCILAIAVHEFGHALGLAHEQNRPDTPGECQAPAQGPDGTRYLTPYDPESVMNYCHPIYRSSGWRLSEKDRTSIQIMYGART